MCHSMAICGEVAQSIIESSRLDVQLYASDLV